MLIDSSQQSSRTNCNECCVNIYSRNLNFSECFTVCVASMSSMGKLLIAINSKHLCGGPALARLQCCSTRVILIADTSCQDNVHVVLKKCWSALVVELLLGAISKLIT